MSALTRFAGRSAAVRRRDVDDDAGELDRSSAAEVCTCRGTMSRTAYFALGLMTAASAARADAPDRGLAGLDEIYPKLDALYIELHKNPELSMKEEKTAARLASELKALGYQGTTGVGGTGVVGGLK